MGFNLSSIAWENPDTPASFSDYVFINGKRFVKPYFFEFIAHVKERWNGKRVVELFSQEFRQRPFEYYVEAVNEGRIIVNGQKVEPSYVVRTTETMSHFVHRHEPPVAAEPVVILEETEDVITVCKPASVPVHPCGQYRKNTVVGILRAEHRKHPLFPIHRLDRLVSGLLIFAKSASSANKFRKDIEKGLVEKLYIAKVKGVFPESEVVVQAAISYDAREGRSSVEIAEKGILSPTSDKNSNGKEACTKFKRIRTDGVYSIVHCVPLTGRTHQIRVHLKYLGHPIANDALYLDDNPPKRSVKGTSADAAARKTLNEEHSLHIVGNKRSNFEPQTINQSVQKSIRRDTVANKLNEGGQAMQLLEEEIDQGADKDPLCTHCPKFGPAGYDEDLEGLWLHCLRYSTTKWSFECSLPSWAM